MLHILWISDFRRTLNLSIFFLNIKLILFYCKTYLQLVWINRIVANQFRIYWWQITKFCCCNFYIQPQCAIHYRVEPSFDGLSDMNLTTWACATNVNLFEWY